MTAIYLTKEVGEQGWRSPPTNVARVRFPVSALHMWVEFVVGSRPRSEGFSPGSPVFLPPQKPTFPNSNSFWYLRAAVLSVVTDC